MSHEPGEPNPCTEPKVYRAPCGWEFTEGASDNKSIESAMKRATDILEAAGLSGVIVVRHDADDYGGISVFDHEHPDKLSEDRKRELAGWASNELCHLSRAVPVEAQE